MSVLPVGFGSAVAGGYQIERSLRFNSADSAYLNRTLTASSTSSTTYAWSAWVKRSTLASARALIGYHGNTAGTGNMINIEFVSDTLRIYFDGAGSTGLQTTAVYRDPSAWYHIVLVYDSTQTTPSNRAKLYVNGVQVTVFSSANYPALNQAINAASTNIQLLGATIGPTNFFNGYMTEINFIDGYPTGVNQGTWASFWTTNCPLFGQTNASTGVWEPIAYSGTYGTNGFYLKFADNSGTTSTTLGKDSSGNGNNWTPNNFSVTAGAGNDSLVDSPTSYGTDTGAGGEVRGNYATFNSVETNYGTLSNGNLNASLAVTGTTGRQARGTFLFPASGKYYFEVNPTTLGVAGQIGIAKFSSATNGGNGITPAFSAGDVYLYLSNGQKQDGVTSSAYGASYTTTNTIGVAVDVDNSTLTFYKDGVSQGTAYSSLTLRNYYPVVHAAGSTGTFTSDINFGQRPFAYTAPSGFKALCTQNLPTPTIGATSTTQANDYFNAVLYTGNGTSQTVTGFGFNPDMVWHKGRSVAYNHSIVDVIRGNSNVIFTNTTDAEQNPGAQLALATDGATVTYRAANLANNQSSATYVIWGWKANGTGVTNTAGTITSTVSANTTSGFSIVTYTGTGANATVGHGLGVTPAMIIVKNRDSGAIGGAVYHTSMGATKYLKLFQTTTGTDGETTDNTAWNGSSPTFNSNVFSVGSLNRTNSSQQMVAYCFAPVAGYSAFGSYTGNGAADGPFVYLGFRPAFVMVKNLTTAATSNWVMKDKLRAASYNPATGNLYANLNFAEDVTATVEIDLLSNGFKIRGTYAGINGSTNSIIYMAFAENPFKYSLAR